VIVLEQGHGKLQGHGSQNGHTSRHDMEILSAGGFELLSAETAEKRTPLPWEN
jgi:hypothetical protein